MSRTLSRLLVSGTLITLGFGLAACGTRTAEPEPPVQAEPAPPAAEPVAPAPPAAEPVAPAPAEPSAGPLDALAAVDLALATLPGGAVAEVDRGTEAGRPTWEVIVRGADGRGTELYFDANSGELLKQESAEIPPQALASAPAVPAATAMRTALSATSGMIEDVGLGEEDGRTVWEVLVAGGGGRIEHYIDATTGSVIKQEAR